MNEIIEFDVVEEYNIFKVGIPIDTNLKLGDRKLDVIARIDTGSTFCVLIDILANSLELKLRRVWTLRSELRLDRSVLSVTS